MTRTIEHLNASEAARRLGVSAKALRLYERRGLIEPMRSAAGWRAYGPEQMKRAAEIAGLRALGFSLAQIARVLAGDARSLEQALAEHQRLLDQKLRGVAAAVEAVRGLRDGIARGEMVSATDVARLLSPEGEVSAAFDLPWPWGGERFELRGLRALTWIIGPLGSGKTRLAMRLAEELPGAVFLPLYRAVGGSGVRLETDAALKARVERAMAWLVEDGAVESAALLTLLCEIEGEGRGAVVVDMIEEGLDAATQEALAAHLRRRGPEARPLLMLTRSSAMLDLESVGADEAIILCPANHSPPMRVAPCPGSPGYEAVATCLASPEVRARTHGMMAFLPERAA